MNHLDALFIGFSVILGGSIMKYGWDHKIFPAWLIALTWAPIFVAMLLEHKPN